MSSRKTASDTRVRELLVWLRANQYPVTGVRVGDVAIDLAYAEVTPSRRVADDDEESPRSVEEEFATDLNIPPLPGHEDEE